MCLFLYGSVKVGSEQLTGMSWCKNSDMVFCFQNCSDLLWEEIVLVIKKNFWNLRHRGWRPRIYKNFEITRTICLNNERSEHFLVTECFSNFSCMFLNPNLSFPNFSNSRPSASNFKSFSRSLEQFLLTVGQNNFGNKISLTTFSWRFLISKKLEQL